MKIQKVIRYTSVDLPVFRYLPHLKMDRLNHIPILPKSEIQFTGQNWQKSEEYLYAIDLFNNQFYWEVHEVLEKIWLEVGKTSPPAVFVQGIIQLSIAMVKKMESNPAGVKAMVDKALPKLLSQKGIYLGIDIENLIGQAENFIQAKGHTAPLIHLHFE